MVKIIVTQLPQKVTFSWPNMCNICCNHSRSLLVKSPLFKKWHYLDLICSVYIVTITIGLTCSKKSRLKKWHFPDLVYSVHVVTIITGLSYSNRSRLKKWHFLDLICSVLLVPITFGVSSRLSIFSTWSNHYNWVKL